MTKDEVLRTIREQIDAPGAIEILDEGVRSENEWWYVPVKRKSDLPKTYEYYDLLATLEERLDEEKNLNVLFVPTAD